MSLAVESAVAPAPLDMGALERRLIEVRGEIDAILAQLAASSWPLARQCAAPVADTTAEGASVNSTPAQAVPDTTAAREETLAEIEMEAASEEIACGPEASAHDDAGETAQPEPASDAEPAAEETTKPTLGLTAALAACQVVATEEPAAMASTDAEVTARGPESGTTEDAIPADATAMAPLVDAGAQAEAIADARAVAAADVAVAAEEPAAAAVADAATDVALQPTAAAAEAPHPAIEAPAAPAAAVIGFEPRQRKQKADLVATKTEAGPRWRRRRVVSRIAAGIVALIAAAGALVLADREALGGPQTLPWVSPLPSYRMPWPVFGPHKRAEGAVETGMSASGGTVGGEVSLGASLGRLGEIWSMSP